MKNLKLVVNDFKKRETFGGQRYFFGVLGKFVLDFSEHVGGMLHRLSGDERAWLPQSFLHLI